MEDLKLLTFAVSLQNLKIEDYGNDKEDFFIRFEISDKFYDLQIHNNGTWSLAETE